MESDVEDAVIEAEVASPGLGERASALVTQIRELPIHVLAVAALILIGGSGGAVLYGDRIVEWIKGEPDYQLIDFDPEQARIYAQALVDLGHPEWEGRLSGTIEEKNTADSIKFNFNQHTQNKFMSTKTKSNRTKPNETWQTESTGHQS